MALIDLKTVLNKAYANQYAVGAFNVVNLDFLEAIIKAAEETQSPVILQIAEVHFKYVSIENICPAIRAVAERAKVPVVLNLDHGETFEAIVRAVQNGFTSVMFDGSSLSYEENIRQTCEVVKMCKAAGISVEAELGAVGGEEGGGLEGEANPLFFTDPAQAKEFVARTGIDCLAVAIGNSHGKYKGKPQLDFERLRAIKEATGIPLVLHGGSGISPDDFQKAISLGISKINFFTGMSQAALQATERQMALVGKSYNDYPELLAQVKQGVTDVVKEQINIFKGNQLQFKDVRKVRL